MKLELKLISFFGCYGGLLFYVCAILAAGIWWSFGFLTSELELPWYDRWQRFFFLFCWLDSGVKFCFILLTNNSNIIFLLTIGNNKVLSLFIGILGTIAVDMLLFWLEFIWSFFRVMVIISSFGQKVYHFIWCGRYCKCEMPYNPDDLMVQCEGCSDW